ncbi:MAG: leucyl aminopeptidase [Gammaproteobacteria bacterium]|nr:leucyl aminopeptidase [Gammaproteobacteria bacterium]MDH5803355.1 leucyl aminopeptidase [Gammaproteobacteria bacterium]
MEFSVKSGSPEKQRTACVVVGVFEPRRLSNAGEQLDEATDGFLSSLLRRGDIEGKIGQTLLLHNVANTLAERILLVGCGRERELGDSQYRKIISKAASILNETGSMEGTCYLTELNVKTRDMVWNVRQAVEISNSALYEFQLFKSKKADQRRPLRKLIFCVPKRSDLAGGEKAVREGIAISNGVKLAKDLGNLPPNVCDPSYLASQAKDMAKTHDKLKVTVHDQAAIEKLQMGAFLCVAKGSRRPPKFIVFEYQGGPKTQKPVVLVGKGITFDSGGISIKPSAAMDEMKYDMCGAAAVFGVMKSCTELNLPLNVVVLVPTCENKPDGNATNPGDIVTSMSGLTIEVLNTDAEGRLILCDALTYAERYSPNKVVDIATLTGACVIALGHHVTGILGNHNPLIHELLNAGKASGDRAWGLPLLDEYQEQLRSNFADIPNVAGRDAGTITAACFLSRFAKKYHWAHMDIAGTAWISGAEKGATGRPVPLLTQFLIDQCVEEQGSKKKS